METDASFEAGERQTAGLQPTPSGPRTNTDGTTDPLATTVCVNGGSDSDDPAATAGLDTPTATTVPGPLAADAGGASPQGQGVMIIGSEEARMFTKYVTLRKYVIDKGSSNERNRYFLIYSKSETNYEFELRIFLDIPLQQANSRDGTHVQGSSLKVAKLSLPTNHDTPENCLILVVNAIAAIVTWVKDKYDKVHSFTISAAELEKDTGPDRNQQNHFLPRKFILSLHRPDHRHCSYLSSFPNSFTFQICATTTLASTAT